MREVAADTATEYMLFKRVLAGSVVHWFTRLAVGLEDVGLIPVGVSQI